MVFSAYRSFSVGTCLTLAFRHTPAPPECVTDPGSLVGSTVWILGEDGLWYRALVSQHRVVSDGSVHHLLSYSGANLSSSGIGTYYFIVPFDYFPSLVDWAPQFVVATGTLVSGKICSLVLNFGLRIIDPA